ncbi:hypothetical protein FBZ89_114123 [Nitrospirillum amazonense]|uniref:Uncharacterized protein n=1 Tax=Nitrospirillum amazonense TaxID=28077 RepID=A0A560F1M7_9PROT|nr:hypothetical protein [Nitrospirillum amazonense]TWB15529.1 hypothetical protein FBZ89_114123 [Nitrospirillum amazonense]
MSATALVMRPMEWTPLQDIDAVEPIGEGDTECLKEMYAVLKRHGKAARFGVTLLHKHFAMGDDEVLLEHTDPATRRLVLQPAKVDSPEVGRSMQTSWMLTEDQGAVTNTACYRRCERNIHGNHEMGGHYWA